MSQQLADRANDLDFLSSLVKKAEKGGADAADAVLFESMSLEVSYRLGKREDLERSESKDLGLRIFKGQKQAIVSSTDITASSLDELLERGLSMAAAMPDDPYCGLADTDHLSKNHPDLDLNEDHDPAPEALYDLAAKAEEAALAVDGVSNSENAGAGWNRNRIALVTSSGFTGSYATSSHSIFASVIAGEGTAMERDYDFSSARHTADLDAPEKIGTKAGEQAVKRLKPRKVESRQVPVLFDPRVSRSILGHFSSAIGGTSVARGTSFLKDSLDTAVFKPDIGPPSPNTTNLYMQPGDLSPEELIGGIDDGLYVTELIGFGVNGVTGDYSRGGAGFWIEKGELAYPVSELTIAGNLRDMFLETTPANDLIFRYGSNAPTLRIDGLMVAGT